MLYRKRSKCLYLEFFSTSIIVQTPADDFHKKMSKKQKLRENYPVDRSRQNNFAELNSTTCSCSTGLLRFLLLLRKKRMKKRYITVIRFSLLDFQPFSCNRASGMFIVTKHKSLTLPDSAFSFRKSLNKKSFLCFSAYSLSIRGTPFFVRLILCRKLFKRLSQLQVFF